MPPQGRKAYGVTQVKNPGGWAGSVLSVPWGRHMATVSVQQGLKCKGLNGRLYSKAALTVACKNNIKTILKPEQGLLQESLQEGEELIERKREIDLVEKESLMMFWKDTLFNIVINVPHTH